MIAAIKAAVIGIDLARVAAWAIAGLAIGVTIWCHGYFNGKEELHEYKVEQGMQAARIVVKRGAVTERVVNRYIERAGKTEVQIREVEKEVDRYVLAFPRGLCIDDDWRRLHDAAARNGVSDAPAKPDGGLRTPGGAPGFRERGPGAPDRGIELREASPLRGSPGRVADVGR